MATLLAFVLAGAVPLLSFLTGVPVEHRFLLASALTLLTLFAVGAARSTVAGGRWIVNGLEMLAVGATAAAVAYGVGRLLGSAAPGAGV